MGEKQEVLISQGYVGLVNGKTKKSMKLRTLKIVLELIQGFSAKKARPRRQAIAPVSAPRIKAGPKVGKNHALFMGLADLLIPFKDPSHPTYRELTTLGCLKKTPKTPLKKMFDVQVV